MLIEDRKVRRKKTLRKKRCQLKRLEERKNENLTPRLTSNSFFAPSKKAS